MITFDAFGYAHIVFPYEATPDPYTGEPLDLTTALQFVRVHNTLLDLNKANTDPNTVVIGFQQPSVGGFTTVTVPVPPTQPPPPPPPQEPPPPPPPPPPPQVFDTNYVYNDWNGDLFQLVSNISWDIMSWVDVVVPAGDTSGAWRCDPVGYAGGGNIFPLDQPQHYMYFSWGTDGGYKPKINCGMGTNFGYPYSMYAKNHAMRNLRYQENNDEPTHVWSSVPIDNNSITTDITNISTILRFLVAVNYSVQNIAANNYLETYTVTNYPYDIYLKSVKPVLDNNGLNMYSAIEVVNSGNTGVIVYYANGGSVTNSQSAINVTLNLTVRNANDPNMALEFEFVDSRGVTFIKQSFDPIIQLNVGDYAGVMKVRNGGRYGYGYGTDQFAWWAMSSDSGRFDVDGIDPIVPVGIYYDFRWD